MKLSVKIFIACMVTAVLVCLAFVLHNIPKTQEPYQHLDSEEVESIRVMWGELVIHDMSESEITEFVTIMNRITHSGKAKDYELSVGSDLNKVFILVYSDGKSESIGAESIWGGKESGYLFINQQPYNSASEELSLIEQKWSEYYQDYYYSQEQKGVSK